MLCSFSIYASNTAIKISDIETKKDQMINIEECLNEINKPADPKAAEKLDKATNRIKKKYKKF
jgi:hypothetical protein